MPAPEPDLDAIVPLLWPQTWRDGRRPDWLARRNAAAVALCWLCGASVSELARIRVRDWLTARPRPAVRLTVPDGDNDLDAVRNRLAPIPPAARLVVDSYIAHAPFRRRPDALLIPADDGSPLRPGVPPIRDPVVARAAGGRVKGLRDLVARYRRYLDHGGPDVDVRLRLAGRGIGKTLGVLRLAADDDPRLARVLERVHPLGGRVDPRFMRDRDGLRRF